MSHIIRGVCLCLAVTILLLIGGQRLAAAIGQLIFLRLH